LRYISKPIASDSSQLGSAAAVNNSKPSHTKNESDRSAGEGFKGSTIQRIARPISIRRAKLIWASVDGAVQQALMASRARGSTRPACMQKKTSGGNKHFSSQRSSDTRSIKPALQLRSRISSQKMVKISRNSLPPAAFATEIAWFYQRDNIRAALLVFRRHLLEYQSIQ